MAAGWSPDGEYSETTLNGATRRSRSVTGRMSTSVDGATDSAPASRRPPVARLSLVPRSPIAAERLFRVLRRTLAAVLGVQLALAVGLTLVDSYRRRGKRPRPFPVTAPREVAVGDGALTTYTYGRDLYEAMLDAIDSAERQVLFETYIWKGDELGERFKVALARAAERGVDVHVIYDGFANLVVSPRFKRFPASIKVLRYPVYPAG